MIDFIYFSFIKGFLSSIVLVYILVIAFVIYKIKRPQQSIYKGKRHKKAKYGVSVIVPFRNEINGIKELINSIRLQSIEYLNMEFIFVDDHSDDHTAEYIRQTIPRAFDFKVIESSGVGKKAALVSGISQSKYGVILTVDADCVFEPNGIYYMYDTFRKYQPNLLCGPIRISGNSVFERSQAIESAALVAISSAFLNSQKPATCNGANLMYKKSLFFELGAFDHKGQHASGDDDLLMHKFAQYDIRKVRYTMDSVCMVTTAACPDLKSFVNQRLRWLSKRKAYLFPYNLMLQWLFLFKTVFLVLLPLELYLDFQHNLLFVIGVMLVDLAMFLSLKRAFKLRFTPFFFVYQLYPILLLFKIRRNEVEWKGRKIR